MPDVLTIGGSPSIYSKSAALLDYTRNYVENHGLTTTSIQVREIPAEALLLAQFQHPSIQESIRLVSQARAVVFATPIYKAAYSGLLKTFLDILPQNALTGKLVLSLATGGSLAHTMALDYALKPVLASLGARHFLPGVFMTDTQVQLATTYDSITFHTEVEERFHSSLEELVHTLGPAEKSFNLLYQQEVTVRI